MQHKNRWVSGISGAAGVIQYPARSRIMLHDMHQRPRKMHKISMDLGYKTVWRHPTLFMYKNIYILFTGIFTVTISQIKWIL